MLRADADLGGVSSAASSSAPAPPRDERAAQAPRTPSIPAPARPLSPSRPPSRSTPHPARSVRCVTRSAGRPASPPVTSPRLPSSSPPRSSPYCSRGPVTPRRRTCWPPGPRGYRFRRLALGAGLLGAFAFGDEFRHPALAADRGTVPRRLGLLCAKLVVAAAVAVSLAFLVVASDAVLLHLVYGEELTEVPADWLSTSASWLALVVGCAWAGVLAAGVFRSTTAGLAAVLAVPVLVVPLVQKALEGPSVRTAAGLPSRLRDLALVHWPFGAERVLAAGLRMIAQPVGSALMLSLTALLCAYLLTVLRPRAR